MKKYEIGFGHKLFDGSEPEIKTYESLEEWTDTSAYIVEEAYEEVYFTLHEAYDALRKEIEYIKSVYTDDGLYWFTLDLTKGEWSDPVDTIVYIRVDGEWKKVA